MRNLTLLFSLFFSITLSAQQSGQLQSNFQFSSNLEQNYSFQLPITFEGTSSFQALNTTIGYSQVNDDNRVFTYLFSYTQDNEQFLDLKSIGLQTRFGTNLFNWKVLYFNLYIDINASYDLIKIIGINYKRFAFGGGASAELDIKFSEKIVISPSISHLASVYNLSEYRFYYQSGITLKYNL